MAWSRSLVYTATNKTRFVSRFHKFLYSTGSERMDDINVETKGSVAIVRMQSGENRFTPDFLTRYLAILDEVENNEDIKALVTTGEGKFYSNGLDLQGMVSYSSETMDKFNMDTQLLYKRILTFPMVTIAAINGHVYAAGGLLALAHDYRVMRKERGWFCLPEINLPIPFSVSMIELAKAKLPQSVHIDSIVMGKRYTAEEAERVGIINTTCPGDEVLDTALKLAETSSQQNYDRTTMSQIKNDLYYFVVKTFTERTRNYAKL